MATAAPKDPGLCTVCGKPVVRRAWDKPKRTDRCANCGRDAARKGLERFMKAHPYVKGTER